LLRNEAERLAQQLMYAQQESRANEIDIEWRFDSKGYRFVELPPVRLLSKASSPTQNSVSPRLVQGELAPVEWESDSVQAFLVTNTSESSLPLLELEKVLQADRVSVLRIPKNLPASFYQIILVSGNDRVQLISDALGEVQVNVLSSNTP
jgi:hypothetical protein